MATGPNVDALRQANQFFLVLWLANLFTVGMLAGVGYFLATSDPEIDPFVFSPEALSHPLVYVLYGVAIVFLILAFQLPPRLAKKRVSPADVNKPGPLVAEVKIRLMAPYIIRIALMESSALVGFLLAVVTQSYLAGLPLMAAAIVLLLISRPAEDLLRSFVKDGIAHL